MYLEMSRSTFLGGGELLWVVRPVEYWRGFFYAQGGERVQIPKGRTYLKFLYQAYHLLKKIKSAQMLTCRQISNLSIFPAKKKLTDEQTDSWQIWFSGTPYCPGKWNLLSARLLICRFFFWREKSTDLISVDMSTNEQIRFFSADRRPGTIFLRRLSPRGSEPSLFPEDR